MSTLSDAKKKAIIAAKKKAKLEGVRQEKILIKAAFDSEMNRKLSNIKQRYTGSELSTQLKKFDEELVNGHKRIEDTSKIKETKIINSAKKQSKKFGGSLSKKFANVKAFAKKYAGHVQTGYNKLPYKKTTVGIAAVLATAIFIATYKRYKALEDERLKKLKDRLENR